MTTLMMPKRRGNASSEFAFLDMLPFHVGICSRQDAERFGEWLTDEAKRFCAARGRPFPAPDHILNPRPKWEGGRRG